MIKGKKETVYSFGLSILSKGITYLLLLVFANYFTQADYGRASFVLSVFHLTSVFAFMGLSTVFLVWYIKKKDVSSVFYFLSISGTLFFIMWLIGSIKYFWTLPFALVIPFIFFSSIGSVILKSKHKYHLTQAFDVLFVLVTLVVAVLLSNLGKAGIILAYSSAYLIVSLGVIFLTRNEIREITRKFRIKIASIKEYLLAGLVTTLVSFSFSFLGWLDSTILGLLSSFENVAIYNIVGPISNILTIIPLSLGAFLLTRTSELKNKDISRRVFLRVLRVAYSVTILLAILLVSILPILFDLFFPKYVGNEVYVAVLSTGIIFYGIYFLTYTRAMGELKQEKALLPIVGAALLNILLDVMLIPKYGLWGITIATTLAHLTAFTLITRELGFLGKLKKMILFAILVPLAFILGYWGLLLVPITAFLLYRFELIQDGDIKVVLDTLKQIAYRK